MLACWSVDGTERLRGFDLVADFMLIIHFDIATRFDHFITPLLQISTTPSLRYSISFDLPIEQLDDSWRACGDFGVVRRDDQCGLLFFAQRAKQLDDLLAGM